LFILLHSFELGLSVGDFFIDGSKEIGDFDLFFD